MLRFPTVVLRTKPLLKAKVGRENQVFGQVTTSILSAQNKAFSPHSGKKMLRFYQTYHDSEVVQPDKSSYMCTQQQLIDIRDLRLAHPEARLTAEIKAHFNRIDAGPTTDSQFTVGTGSITGSPSNPFIARLAEGNRLSVTMIP